MRRSDIAITSRHTLITTEAPHQVYVPSGMSWARREARYHYATAHARVPSSEV